MTSVAVTEGASDAQPARQGGRADVARLWRALRVALLAAHAPLLARTDRLPCRPDWNLPLWELGHVAWFAERWTLRQPEPERGPACDPTQALPPGLARDDWYDSSAVPHAQRWTLPLPSARDTQALLDAQLAASLQRLATLTDDGDDALYLFRLAVLHEAMHLEAARLLARALGLPTPAPRARPPAPPLSIAATTVRLGGDGPGFGFDNELGEAVHALPAFEIDAHVRRWRDLLPWVDSAYRDDHGWSAAGRRWRGTRRHPDALQGSPGDWRGPDGRALALDAPAEPLSAFEAEAWCAWAGRRLPTEAEWGAASRHPGFVWGEAWEWTATPFAPFAGFQPHPYRDYSLPWFDGAHRVLKGASRFTPGVLVHPAFRNFYRPERSDLVAGVRSCVGL